jgi:diadenosine tetraphosphate (Ap4A) HIT family hydrolase
VNTDPINFHFSALLNGTVRQRRAYEVLADLNLLDVLAPYNPLLAGTIPLGFDTSDSDLDIVCEVYEIAPFTQALYDAFSGHELFGLRFKGEYQAWICDFFYQGFQVQIFAQDCPSSSSPAYRHLVAQARLLSAAGAQAREEISRLRSLGLKIQPAFAEYFALPGDAYDALLALADAPESRLQEVVRRAKTVRESCPVCRLIHDSQREPAYQDAYWQIFMEQEAGGTMSALVVPRRHVERFYDLGERLAGHMGRTLVRASQALQFDPCGAGVNLREFAGAAGDGGSHLHFRLQPGAAGSGDARPFASWYSPQTQTR